MLRLKFKVAFNVLVFTCIIGLAISYATQLLKPYIPQLNFLEAVGVYCIWTPINHFLLSLTGNRTGEMGEE
jgi:uncharacterized membrane protein (DUF373 family)